MKLVVVGVAVAVMMASGAGAQVNQPPPADQLAVKPIPSQVQTVDSDVIRTKIEQAGYTEISELSRDTTGVWRARAKKGDAVVNIAVDKGGRIKPDRR